MDKEKVKIARANIFTALRKFRSTDVIHRLVSNFEDAVRKDTNNVDKSVERLAELEHELVTLEGLSVIDTNGKPIEKLTKKFIVENSFILNFDHVLREEKEQPKERVLVNKHLEYSDSGIEVYSTNSFNTPLSFVRFNKNERTATVAILPIRINEEGKIEVLANLEFVPAWATYEDDRHVVCVTGGVDEGEHLMDAASRELAEETGYVVKPEHFQLLGSTFANKALASPVYCVLVDLSGAEKSDTDPGDGIEELIETRWFGLQELLNQSVDAILRNMAVEFMYTMIMEDARKIKKEDMKQDLMSNPPNRKSRRDTEKAVNRESKKRVKAKKEMDKNKKENDNDTN